MSVTPEQQRAIKARGKVLVSASAGAGKTTVMITRLADVLEEGASLDEVLAVTFTKKAAAQMKTKLRSELIARLATAAEDKRENIRVQLGKINSADISTIHSFCARLLRTYFYVLGVDSSFEVASDSDVNALRRRAADDLFDELYEAEDKDFYYLLERLRKKRSDDNLKRLLFAAYDELRIRPDYEKYLGSVLDDTYTDEGFERVCARYGESVAAKFTSAIAAIDSFSASFSPALNGEGYKKVLGEMRDNLSAFVAHPDVFNPPERLAISQKPRVKSETAEDDARFAAFCNLIKKRYRSAFGGIEDRETERQRFFSSGELARAFAGLISKFDEAYSGVKREEGKLDYGDLEHLALKLLKGEGCDGDVRAEINGKYKYVFVDEYQDVNAIQDEILSAVSGGDLFCVGDVKQAIYAFRGSSSRFFSDKCAGAEGEYVILPDNFRSSRAVIDFVNDVFSSVMIKRLCGFDYADGHAMRGGARYPKGYEGESKIYLFDGGEKTKIEAKGVYSVSAHSAAGRELTAEGKAVLALIERALNGTYFDPDDGVEKKVQPGDICVLTRKRSNKNAQGVVRAITTKYPVAGAAEVNVCDRPEIKKLLDVLSYIDNVEQDIPLAAALLSPLGGFTESDLAQIRAFGGTGANAPLFRECAARYASRRTDTLAVRLKQFYKRTENLRSLSDCIGAAKLIDVVAGEAEFAALFDSDLKQAALRRFQGEAFAIGGELSLNAFLARLTSENFRVLAPASLSADCVKVMTMHASKGLEFPVVIVADIAAGFKGDERAEVAFDEEFGLAPDYYGEGRVVRSNMLKRLCRARGEREELEGEINLFYVACTRAKYKLYLLCGGAEEHDEMSAPYAENYADLFNVKGFNPDILPVEYQKTDGENVGARVVDLSRADEETLEKIKEVAGFKYGYQDGVGLPVKSSASRILSLRDDITDAQPLFVSDGADAVEEGVAYHRFFELCDFSKKTAEEIALELSTFVYNGLLSDGQRKLLDVGQLTEILAMPAFGFGERVELYREREFLCKLPASDYSSLQSGGDGFSVGEDDGNGVIVQGAIDLLSLTRADGKIVGAHITDYKYSAHSDGYLVQKYTPQLKLYKSVVCKIYGLPPSAVGTTLINIRARRQIEIV